MNAPSVWFRRLRTVLPVIVSLFLVGATSTVALAHPAPSVLHDYVIRLTQQSLTVTSYLRISPELVPEIYRQIDTDKDATTSVSEYQAWLRAHPSMLRIALDGVAVQTTLSAPPSVGMQDLLLSVNHPLVVTYTFAPGKALSGKHRIRLTYGDNYLAYDEYYVSVAGDLVNDGLPAGVSRPVYPATYQVIYQMPDPSAVQTSNVPMGRLAPAPWSALGSQPVQQAQGTAPQGTTQGDLNQGTASTAQAPSNSSVPASSSPSPSGPISQLLDTLRNWRGELWTALGMLALALTVGALHALTPGHGKAMVAAYLVGSRGRVRDALLLGGVVTLTHTAGVVILGLILLLVSNFAMPRALTPALQLASGLLVMGLGVYLFVSRWLESRGAPAAEHLHLKERAHHRVNLVRVKAGASESTSVAGAASLALVGMVPISSSLPVRLKSGGNSVASEGSIQSFTGGSQTAHSHDHGLLDHSHDIHGHVHSHVGTPSGVRALIGLGVSGGLVPCPDALAILLLGASVGQFALGLSLVLSFSVGLAGVLMAIGVALVKMKGALERTWGTSLSTAPLLTRWVPLASAAVVATVGALMLVAAMGYAWS